MAKIILVKLAIILSVVILSGCGLKAHVVQKNGERLKLAEKNMAYVFVPCSYRLILIDGERTQAEGSWFYCSNLALGNRKPWGKFLQLEPREYEFSFSHEDRNQVGSTIYVTKRSGINFKAEVKGNECYRFSQSNKNHNYFGLENIDCNSHWSFEKFPFPKKK